VNGELQYEQIIIAEKDNPTQRAKINVRVAIFFITSEGNHNAFLGSQ